ncbi:hypothetical protein HS088_TW18G00376 [Tripterygium wilfordii]|uniref:Uncharacterized protein n=1 Tax=Tripterygium wilfordii TaxID=458696 RepID=A0A7J7CC61_TRIWF|nr:uncharacterized protein LOC119984683 [Tripterygium wilfordii]KAF5731692.1 hypothetical protein HS088_TW18G00376 [Tripterygium wilfordii]
MNTTSSSSAEKPLSIPLPDLIASLDQATFMAKQLPITTDPNHLLQIYSSLHHAHNLLSSFLSKTQFPPFPPAPAENSGSSATAGAGENGEEPMQIGGDEEAAEDNSKTSIDKVEERMRDVFIRNKRPKRPLSPSSAAVRERKVCEDGYVVGMKNFDPHETKSRALELVYQFHG